MVEKTDSSAIKYCINKKLCVGNYEQIEVVGKSNDISQAIKRFERNIPLEAKVVVDYVVRLKEGKIFENPTKYDVWEVSGIALIKK